MIRDRLRGDARRDDDEILKALVTEAGRMHLLLVDTLKYVFIHRCCPQRSCQGEVSMQVHTSV